MNECTRRGGGILFLPLLTCLLLYKLLPPGDWSQLSIRNQTVKKMMAYITCFFGIFLCTLAAEAPQSESPAPPEKPMPYEYNYKVEEANSSLYYGAQEAGNEAGRVEGSYYVWLPNGRLMKVSYYIDGDSGYNPTITFEDNANPFGTVGST